jgi:hypothetical protein
VGALVVAVAACGGGGGGGHSNANSRIVVVTRAADAASTLAVLKPDGTKVKDLDVGFDIQSLAPLGPGFTAALGGGDTVNQLAVVDVTKASATEVELSGADTLEAGDGVSVLATALPYVLVGTRSGRLPTTDKGTDWLVDTASGKATNLDAAIDGDVEAADLEGDDQPRLLVETDAALLSVDPAKLDRPVTLEEFDAPPVLAALTPDGRFAVDRAPGNDAPATVFDLENGTKRQVTVGSVTAVTGVVGDRVILFGVDEGYAVFDAASDGTETTALDVPTDHVPQTARLATPAARYALFVPQGDGDGDGLVVDIKGAKVTGHFDVITGQSRPDVYATDAVAARTKNGTVVLDAASGDWRVASACDLVCAVVRMGDGLGFLDITTAGKTTVAPPGGSTIDLGDVTVFPTGIAPDGKSLVTAMKKDAIGPLRVTGVDGKGGVELGAGRLAAWVAA